MKKCLTLLLTLGSFTIFAADNPYQKMTKEDCNEILNRIRQLDFAINNRSFFIDREDARASCIDAQLDIMKGILRKYSITYPSNPTHGWLNQLKIDLKQEKSSSDEEEMDQLVCDISGLNKADVLRVLYQHAKPGNYTPKPKTSLSQAELEQVISETSGLDFDYFNGCPLKVNLSKDTFDSTLYDRENGRNAAYKAIEQLRLKQNEKN